GSGARTTPCCSGGGPVADSPLLTEVIGLVRSAAKIGPRVVITPQSRLVEDLGIDSLDLVGVFLRVQDHYDLLIEDEDLPGLRSVAGLARFVARRRDSTAA